MLQTLFRAIALIAVGSTVASGQAPAPIAVNGGYPAVSPDGKRIAFLSSRDGQMDIYTATIDGASVARVTNSRASEGPPQWVDNGQALAFDTADARFTMSAVLVAPASGGTVRQLGIVDGSVSVIMQTDRVLHALGDGRANRMYVSDPSGTSRTALTDSSAWVTQMVYSPDRTRIAYIQRDSGEYRLWIMQSDGSGPRPMGRIGGASSRVERPSWSPDGTRLALQIGTVQREARRIVGSHIWIVDVESGRATQLSPHDDSYSDNAPSWFPDGRRIAFHSDRSGRREVWVMNADGSGAQQVTR